MTDDGETLADEPTAEEQTADEAIDRSPALLSTSIALFAGTVSLLGSALGSIVAVAPSAAGVLALGIGLLRGSRRALLLGSGGLLAGVILAGAEGAGPAALLVGTLGAVLAWDVGEHGIGVGEQLGREADTTRGELAHAALSVTVGAVAAAIGFGAYLAAAGGQPVTALVFFLLGAVLLVSALR
jgi:hypothetical protein